MNLRDKIEKLSCRIGLNQDEKSILDDFVDNCIGNYEEGYISNS